MAHVSLLLVLSLGSTALAATIPGSGSSLATSLISCSGRLSTPAVSASSASVASSSRRLSASSRRSSLAAATGISTGDCPPVTTTTRTLTQTYFEDITTISDPVVETIYVYSETTTISTSFSTNYTEYRDRYTSTTTYPGRTSVVYNVVTASTTVTIPTPDGFTPILCNAAYFNPVVTVNTTWYGTAFYPRQTTTIIEPTPSTFYDFTSSTIDISTVYSEATFVSYTILPDVTVTSTRADPTSTVYAACATNNITPEFPKGKYRYVGYAAYKDTFGSGTSVPALDAADCCALCQANSTCTGSAFQRERKVNPCDLFIRPAGNATCDTRFNNAGVYNGYPYPIIDVSNGGCGGQLDIPWYGTQ